MAGLSIWLGPMVRANLLPYGGFESGNLAEWSEAGSAVVSTEHVRTGVYSVRMTTGDLRAVFATVPGTPYKVTGWVKIVAETGSDWGGFRVAVSDYPTWQQLGHSGNLLTATHGSAYFKVALNFTALATSSRLQIGYFGGPGRQMTVHVDDIAVEVFDDNEPPVISATTLTPQTIGDLPATQTFSVTANDPDGSVATVSWDFGDGGRATDAGGTRRVAGPGTYSARVTVVDDDGARTTQEIQWTAADPEWPALGLTEPAEGAVLNAAAVTVSGTAGAGETRVSSDRGKSIVAGSGGAFSVSLPMEPGWNRVLVQVRDAAGHVSTVERRVRHVPDEPLAVTGVTESAASIGRWEMLDIAFGIAGSAATQCEHPFAAEPPPGLEGVDGITVDALFTPDNWTTVLRRPAYWHQPWIRELRENQEWMVPQGAPRWHVRFAPPTTGAWQYRIEVLEAKGAAVSATRGFEVVASADPLNHGPVRVAAADSRYFEHADGTPYSGTGHGAGMSQERYSYDMAEMLDTVGEANQQLFRVWIAGHMWGSAWQPWASRTLAYEGTVPATGLGLGAAFGDGLAAWRLDAANPILFQGFMSGHAGLVPGHSYRVRVRWKTEGVSGPAQAGQPHGVCLKFTAWPEPGQTGTLPVLVAHTAGDTPWHVAEGDFVADGNFLPNLAAILENTTGGTAWIDEIALHEVTAGGVLGPQLLRSPRANQYLHFDSRRGAGLDAILAAAEARDKQLRLVISEKQEWLMERLGPQGLPAANGGQFFAAAGTPGRWLHESWWRHLFARFGASRAVHSWELVNEAAPGNGAHFALANRLAELAGADGNPHPASISTWATLATEAWTNPDYPAIDHADFHAYVRHTGWLGPADDLANDSARFFHDYDLAVRTASLGKPVVWGEMGIDGPATTDDEDPMLEQDLNGVWLHKITWARCGPGGVYPLYWWTANIFSHSLHGQFGAWRRFMAGIPLTNGRYADADAVNSAPDLRAIGQKDTFNGRAHLWLDNRGHTWRRVVDGATITPVTGTVRVNLGRADASVQAQWFDTATGLPTISQNLSADGAGAVTLTVAGLTSDTAVKLTALGGSVAPGPGDWTQHQRDAARTGRTTDAVPPPFRARWIWAGPTRTLRNRDSQSGWPDDLDARPGYTYPNLPANSGVTLAQSVQPAVAAGRVFVGSMEGTAFALGADDGATLWQTALPGPTIATAAVLGGRVFFVCVTGEVVALDAADGSTLWTYDAKKAITGAPCAVDGRILVGAQDGRVHALDAATGQAAWVSAKLGPSIHGGLAAADGRVFVGTEDMTVHALALADGITLATHRVRGQSFRMLWPVVYGGRVWISSVTTPIIGSEYVGESNQGSSLFADSPTLAEEQSNILRWLAGDTNGGRWPEASADWRRLFALNSTDLTESFVIPAAPADGVGIPAQPPVVDSSGRVLGYFKTRHPTLTAAVGAVFGTAYSVDISAIDQTSGLRVPIDNGHLANPWPWETDNLYAMSVAGTQLWLRQNFRGTQVIDLATSTARGVSAEIRNRDGGTFNFDVVYRDSGSPVAHPQPSTMGRSAPAIVGGRIFIAEDWGVTAIEHRP